MEHSSWVEQSIAIQREDNSYHGLIVESYNKSSVLFGDYGLIPYNVTGPHFPSWQGAPVVPVNPPFNWDGAQYPTLVDSIGELFENRRVVISAAINILDPNNPASAAEVADRNNFLKNFLANGTDVSEPASTMFYPIFDTAAEHVDIKNDRTAKPVAVFAMFFFWRDLLTGILPPGTDGIIAVFRNGCNQTFTYEINGPELNYLGSEDLHDPSFDYLGKEASFHDLRTISLRKDEDIYTGLELTNATCPYILRVYPSATFKTNFTSSNPVIFAVAASLIFLFTSVVFLMYDCLVERRQRKVMRTGRIPPSSADSLRF